MAKRKHGIEHVLDFMYGTMTNVFKWRVGYRRAFLLTLPVSLPLWLVYIAFIAVLLVVALVVLLPVIAVAKLWSGEE